MDSNSSGKRAFKKKMKCCVKFYSNIIYNLGGTAKIKQLLNYKCKEIQSMVTNFEDLKNFFRSHQNDFVVANDTVCLVNEQKEDNSEVNIIKNPSLSKAARNAIVFYSYVLRNYKSKTVSLVKISGHRGNAPADVRTVAKNPKELKIFFSQFPDVFTLVNDNKVMLSKSCEKIMLPQQMQETSEIFFNKSEEDAVAYFREMLNSYGLCRVLSIKQLFELKLKSSPAIQKISGSNREQFLTFLKKYAQEFIVTNDNVIARDKIPKWSYKRKYGNEKLTGPLLLFMFNFFKTYTSYKSLFHIDNVYNYVGRFFLYNDKTPIFPSKADLSLFLGHYPHIFFVDNCRIVNIIASGRKAFICSVDNKRNNKTISRTGKCSKSSASVKSLPSKMPKRCDEVKERVLNPSNGQESEDCLGANEMPKRCDEVKERVLNPPNGQESEDCLGANEMPKRCDEVKERVLNPPNGQESEDCLGANEMPKRCDEVKERVLNPPNGQESEDCLGDNEMSKRCDEVKEKILDLCNGQKSEDCLGDNRFPPSIEEIKNNIFSYFSCKENKNFSNNNKEHISPYTTKILNHSFLKKNYGREKMDKSVLEALFFLNGKLWDEGNLKILSIEELFNSFSQPELRMANSCCKNIKEFKNFLCEFPDHFIVSRDKVMAKRNKIEKVCYLFNNEEESVPVLLFHFFNLYTSHLKFILIKQLFCHVGKYFRNMNSSPFFKSPSDLVLFLEMFPDIFYIQYNYIINLTASKKAVDHKVKFKSGMMKNDSFLYRKLYSSLIDVKYSMVPESTDSWNHCVLQRTQIIEDLNQCRAVVAEILNSDKVVALDCEGVNLGAAGELTLIQIGLENGQIYIFDIFKEKLMVGYGGLKDILESKSILKVIHDSRNDVANLYTEYGVLIAPIFDTRVAHHLIVSKAVSPKHIPRRIYTDIGFNELCSKYGGRLNVEKDSVKNIYKFNQCYWKSRPLTKDMIAYAALDVASLFPEVFVTMSTQLKGIPTKLLWELNRSHSLSYLKSMDLLFNEN